MTDSLLNFTDAARRQILDNLDVDGADELALRLTARRRGPGGFDVDFLFLGKDEIEPDDTVVDGGGFEVVLDPDSVECLRGSTVDFQKGLQQIGFTFDNPNVWPDDPVARRVQRVLDHRVNPAVASHSGFITLQRVEDGVAYLEMGGGCQGCGLAEQTLEQGVEDMLRDAVPEIEKVVDTTDHSAGENPWFTGSEGALTPKSPLPKTS